MTDDFFDLGGHSLLAVRLAARIEERFGRSLALSDLLLGSTIEELAARIREPVGSRAGSPLIDLRVVGARPAARTSCIRSAAAFSAINDLARCLDGARAVLGLQAAGFEGEAEPETDLVRMASRYVDALRAEQPGRALHPGRMVDGGHRGFRDGQAARRGGPRRAAGRPDRLLGPRPAERPHGPLSDLESLAAFAADLARTAGRETWASLERLRGLDPESIRNGTFDQTILGREIAGEIGPDRLRRLHDVFRANRLALDGYQPRPYPGRVVLVQAESSRNHLDDRSTRGWNALALGGVTTHHLPGDHYTIMQRPAVERLAEILTGEIDRHEQTMGRIPLR